MQRRGQSRQAQIEHAGHMDVHGLAVQDGIWINAYLSHQGERFAVGANQ